MSVDGGLRGALERHGRRYFWLGLVANFAIGAAITAYAVFGIMPKFLGAAALQEGVAEAERVADEAERAAASTPDELLAQIDAAQNALDALGTVLLNVDAVTALSQALYGYGAETGVQVLSVDTSAEEPPEEMETYSSSIIHVEASGQMARLLLFLTRIDVAGQPAVQFRDLDVHANAGDVSLLSVDLVVYTSPHAQEGVAPEGLEPQPESMPQLRAQLGDAWAREDWGHVVELVPVLLRSRPGDTELLEQLYHARLAYGRQLLDGGLTRKASEQFLSALEIKPNGAEALAALELVSVTPRADTQPHLLSGSTIVPTETTPQATPSRTLAPPSLVKPDGWPTEWPWPPKGRR